MGSPGSKLLRADKTATQAVVTEARPAQTLGWAQPEVISYAHLSVTKAAA